MPILPPDDPRAIRGMRSPIPKMAKQYVLTFEEWGPPCEEHDNECPCCIAWGIYDETLKCPTVGEVLDKHNTTTTTK